MDFANSQLQWGILNQRPPGFNPAIAINRGSHPLPAGAITKQGPAEFSTGPCFST